MMMTLVVFQKNSKRNLPCSMGSSINCAVRYDLTQQMTSHQSETRHRARWIGSFDPPPFGSETVVFRLEPSAKPLKCVFGSGCASKCYQWLSPHRRRRITTAAFLFVICMNDQNQNHELSTQITKVVFFAGEWNFLQSAVSRFGVGGNEWLRAVRFRILTRFIR